MSSDENKRTPPDRGITRLIIDHTILKQKVIYSFSPEVYADVALRRAWSDFKFAGVRRSAEVLRFTTERLTLSGGSPAPQQPVAGYRSGMY